MALYRDHAIVLRTYKLAETDRIVVLLTRQFGKVRAVAKGARRPGSKFGARLEPGSYIEAQLHEGRGELHTVTQVETGEPFPKTRQDLDRLSHMSSLLEAVEQFAQDHEPTPQLFDMLLGGLRTIEARNPASITGAFYLRLLDVEGIRPVLDHCIDCGEVGGPFSMAINSGGVRCQSCGGGKPVSAEALEVCRAVLDGGLMRVLDLPASSVTREVDSLAITLLESHVERRMRSLRLLSRPNEDARPEPSVSDLQV